MILTLMWEMQRVVKTLKGVNCPGLGGNGMVLARLLKDLRKKLKWRNEGIGFRSTGSMKNVLLFAEAQCEGWNGDT